MDLRDSKHKKGSHRQHKLRVIHKSSEREILGISLPSKEVIHLKGCLFTASVTATSIMLSSGCKL